MQFFVIKQRLRNAYSGYYSYLRAMNKKNAVENMIFSNDVSTC